MLCVLVNWNGWQDTLECLRSLEHQTWPALHVVVVDNGSTNESASEIRAFLSGRPANATVRMELLETGANLGFAGGNNAGIRFGLASGPALIWLLNNDTVCPPDTLEKLVRCADENPRAGIVGSVLYFAHNPAQVQAWGGGTVWPSIAWTRHWTAPHPLCEGCYVTFASVLLRPEMLASAGTLDEAFFLYFEDVELCLRAQKAAWELAVAEDTAILHKEGGSSRKTRSGFLEKTVTLSGLRLIYRYGRLRPIGMAVFLAARIFNRIRSGGNAMAVLAALPEFLRTRKDSRYTL